MTDKNKHRDREKPEETGGEQEKSNKELEEILGQLKESGNRSDDAPKIKSDSSEKASPQSQSGNPESGGEPEGIEQILESISEKPEEIPVEKQNPFQRIINVFIAPTRLFEYLRAKPDFIIPLILAILVSMFSAYRLYDMAIDSRISSLEQNDRIPAERRDLMIDQLEASKTGTIKIISTFIVPPISLIIIYSLISAIFLLIGNVFLGGKARFKQIFSAFSYSYLIVILLGSLIKIPLILSKQTLKVDMSPAVLFRQLGEGSLLYKFINSFDVFTVWFVIVFGIGFAVIYRFSKLKGVVSVSIAWLVYVLVFQVWLSNLFKGITG
jgi:hypothetical protein